MQQYTLHNVNSQRDFAIICGGPQVHCPKSSCQIIKRNSIRRLKWTDKDKMAHHFLITKM